MRPHSCTPTTAESCGADAWASPLSSSQRPRHRGNPPWTGENPKLRLSRLATLNRVFHLQPEIDPHGFMKDSSVVLRAVEPPVQLLGAERRLDEQRRSSHKTRALNAWREQRNLCEEFLRCTVVLVGGIVESASELLGIATTRCRSS